MDGLIAQLVEHCIGIVEDIKSRLNSVLNINHALDDNFIIRFFKKESQWLHEILYRWTCHSFKKKPIWNVLGLS